MVWEKTQKVGRSADDLPIVLAGQVAVAAGRFPIDFSLRQLVILGTVVPLNTVGGAPLGTCLQLGRGDLSSGPSLLAFDGEAPP